MKKSILIVLASVFSMSLPAFGNDNPKIFISNLLDNPISIELKNGNTNYEQSGLNIQYGKVTPWSECDLCVADLREKDGPEENFHFFVPNSTEPYLDGDNSQGGIAYAVTNPQTNEVQCPKDGYVNHWFKPTPLRFLCVKTRGGDHFGMLRVRKITDEGIEVSLVSTTKGNAALWPVLSVQPVATELASVPSKP